MAEDRDEGVTEDPTEGRDEAASTEPAPAIDVAAVRQSLASTRELLAQVDAGTVKASPRQRAYLAGAVAGMAAALGEDTGVDT